MTILLLLAPFSLALGLIAVGAFWWTLRDGQYDDLERQGKSILEDDPPAT